MMGGGELIAWFLDAGEIEGFDIHVIPTLIGAGIPLGARRAIWTCHCACVLSGTTPTASSDGVVRLRYEVARQNL
jgi:dihydrofolate reductase